MIHSDWNVDCKIRDHDQYRKSHTQKWEKKEQDDREGVENRQRRPINIYDERNVIITQQAIPMNVYYMVDCPVGKAKNIYGENCLYKV